MVSTEATAGQGRGLRAIGAVAKETGLTPRAIRYYEEVGLLRPAVRVKGADRLFDDEDVQRLHRIKEMREVMGFSIAEIAELLETDDARSRLRSRFHGTDEPAARVAIIADSIALAERRLEIVEQKLRRVEALRHDEQERIVHLRAMLADEELRTRRPPAGRS